MIHFGYNKRTKSYRAFIDLQKMDKDFVSIKFDTGATDTIITTGALGFDDIQAVKLLKSIKGKKLKQTTFTSASNDSFTGYSCYCDDLRIGDVEIKRFYYYIVFNDKPKALLGDDFISCCIFSHGYKGDIVVTAFNYEGYEKQYISSENSMNIFEVLFQG